jgi:hypothetical protein
VPERGVRVHEATLMQQRRSLYERRDLETWAGGSSVLSLSVFVRFTSAKRNCTVHFRVPVRPPGDKQKTRVHSSSVQRTRVLGGA